MKNKISEKIVNAISDGVSTALDTDKEKLMYEQEKIPGETWKQMADRVGFTDWYQQIGRNPNDIGNSYMKARQRWINNNACTSNKKTVNIKTVRNEFEGDVIKENDKILLTNVKALGYSLDLSKTFYIGFRDADHELLKRSWDNSGYYQGFSANMSKEPSLNANEIKNVYDALKDREGENNTKTFLRLNKGRNYEICRTITFGGGNFGAGGLEHFPRLYGFENIMTYDYCVSCHYYIPSLCELNAIFYNWLKIRKMIGGDNEDGRYISIFLKGWSSTAYDENCMWGCYVDLKSNWQNKECPFYNYPISDKYMVVIQPIKKSISHMAAFIMCGKQY